jgi:hypothetical protein
MTDVLESTAARPMQQVKSKLAVLDLHPLEDQLHVMPIPRDLDAASSRFR